MAAAEARRRRGLGQYSQRLAYLLIAAALAGTVGATTLAGFRLHHAVIVERQTLRTQAFSQRTLELQNIALAAQVQMRVTPALAAKRQQAVADANAAFDSLRQHDPAEGARLEAIYRLYVGRSTVAFIAASRNAGAAPNKLEQLVQHSLAALQSLTGAEVASRAAETQRVNPSARRALIAAAIGAGLLVLLLVWQFDLERRSGRIDRDNAYRAEELARLRDEFVAVVSHELRTPLTSIVGYLELLSDDGMDNLTADQKAYLEVVHRSTHRLGELVGDLLLVAEAERAPLALELGAVDIATLAAQAVEAARPVADARGIDLRLDAGTPSTVKGDPTRLAQMLDNLVSNAIKFTPEGGCVTVRAETHGGQAVFEVSDTGHGIGVTDRARLFEPFYRARTATEHAVPGTGLGLTITKAIVDAHRGTIEVDSTPRAGTTFRVRLPEA